MKKTSTLQSLAFENQSQDYIDAWKNLAEIYPDSTRTNHISWRDALMMGGGSAKALKDFTQMLDFLSQKEDFEDSMNQCLLANIDAVSLFEEALRVGNEEACRFILQGDFFTSNLNSIHRSTRCTFVHSGINARIFLGQSLLMGASGNLLKESIQKNWFNPCEKMIGEISFRLSTKASQQSWTPLGWAVAFGNYESFSTLVKDKDVLNHQQSLDEALFWLSAPQENSWLQGGYFKKPKNKTEAQFFTEQKVQQAIRDLLQKGANPNQKFELIFKTKDKQDQEILVKNERTAAFQWVSCVLNNPQYVTGTLESWEDLIENSSSKLDLSNFKVSRVLGSMAFKSVTKRQENPGLKKSVELAWHIDKNALTQPLSLAFALSSKKNKGWPLSWTIEQGNHLSFDTLFKLLGQDFLDKIESRFVQICDILNYPLAKNGYTFQEWGEFLNDSDKEHWKIFSSSLESIQKELKNATQGQLGLREPLLEKMKLLLQNPKAAVVKPSARL